MTRESRNWTALVESPDGSGFDSAYITEWGTDVTPSRPYLDPMIAVIIGELLIDADLDPSPEVQVILQLRRRGRIAAELVPALGRLLDQMFTVSPTQVDPSYVASHDPGYPGPVDRLVNALERNLDVTDLQVMDADGVHLTFDNDAETFVPYAEGGYHPELPAERGGSIIGRHKLGDQMGLQSVIRRDILGPHADAFLVHYPVGYQDEQGKFQQTATVLSPHYLDYMFMRSIGVQYRP